MPSVKGFELQIAVATEIYHNIFYPPLTDISTPDGTTTGRNDNECGHIGQITIDGVLGCTTDAPAASA